MRTPSVKKFNVSSDCWRIRLSAQEAIALGQLIKFQQSEVVFDEDALVGIGEILERLGKRLLRTCNRIEEWSIETARVNCDDE